MKKFINNIKMVFKGIALLFSIEKTYAILHIVSAVLHPLQPYVNTIAISIIINAIIDGSNIETIFFYALITVLINLFLKIVLAIIDNKKNYHLENLFKSEKAYFANHSMSMEYKHIENPTVFALKNRIENENRNGYNLHCLNVFSGRVISSTISIIVALIICGDLFFNQNIEIFYKICLAVCVLISIVINYFSSKIVNKIEMNMYNELVPYNTKSNYYDEYYENYNAGKDVRIYDMADNILNIEKETNASMLNVIKNARVKSIKYNLLKMTLAEIVNIVAYIFVIHNCIEGNVSIGDITKYVGTISILIMSVPTFVSQMQFLFNNNLYLENYFKYLKLSHHNNGGMIAELPKSQKYTIRFDNVSFKYPSSNDFALKNISFEIKQGDRVSIVGRNGSGKTTMIKLLCRLYEPSEGSIYFNNVNINEYSYADYVKLLSVVFQDFKIFSFSIKENIIVDNEYNEAKINKCSTQAGLKEFINKLEDGYNTFLYKDFDNGIEVSGGEAQKIAFSRALYKNSPIFILDEPTAALDPIAESEIYSNFNQIDADKTILFVSHRLASCTFSNKIIVFDSGKLVQEGSHTELLKNLTGLYYELWSAQTECFIK